MLIEELYAAGEQEAQRLFSRMIREATADLHTALEAHPFMSVVTDPAVQVNDYCNYLLLMREVQKQYENLVLPAVAKNFAGKLSPSSHLIERDIQYLGCVEAKTPDPLDLELPLASTSFMLGFVYVMEGSKLGGKVILNHINRKLGFDENRGAAYLAGDGHNTGAHWKSFMQHFSSYVIKNHGAEDAIAGARFAFSFIFHFLENNLLVNEN